jgi:hypothetical protein
VHFSVFSTEPRQPTSSMPSPSLAASAQFLFNGVQRKFGDVEQDQPGRFQGHDLAPQFGPIEPPAPLTITDLP